MHDREQQPQKSKFFNDRKNTATTPSGFLRFQFKNKVPNELVKRFVSQKVLVRPSSSLLNSNQSSGAADSSSIVSFSEEQSR